MEKILFLILIDWRVWVIMVDSQIIYGVTGLSGIIGELLKFQNCTSRREKGSLWVIVSVEEHLRGN
tara:strand:+ start:248 stop:445 length:198 start_codon:yes stop_codon:yes gene_type:complete